MQVFEIFGDLIFRDPNTRERLTQISNAVDTARDKFGMLGMNMQQFGQNMQNMGKGLIEGITKPIGNMVIEGVKYNMTLQDQLTSFETMLGSAAKAKSFMADITKMAAQTPFETSNLTDAAKTLLGFGVANQKVLPLMSKLGDVSLGNEQKFKSLALVMGQVSAGSKLQGGDLLQMINAGWNPLQEMVKMTGKSYKELRKEMEAGNISFDDVSKALDHATSKGGMFFEGMKKGSQTLSGKISTLKDNFIMLLGNATKPLFDFIASKVVPTLSNIIEGFGKAPTSVKIFIGILIALAAAAGPVILGLGGLISVIGAIVAAIGTIGAPVALAIVALTGWIGVLASGGIAILAIAAKTGLLQKAFEGIKNIIAILSATFKGDFSGVMGILQNKFGMSEKNAAKFTLKLMDVRETTKAVIGVVKDVTKVIGAIFSGDSQKLIDLLRNKFGYTRKEAEAFSKKVNILKEKFIELGGKIKNIAIKMLSEFMVIIKKAGNYIYDHRKEIMKVIETFINFGVGSVKAVKKVIAILKDMKNAAKTTMNLVKIAIDPVIIAFNKIISVVGKVITKIKGIKFPAIPNAIKGFFAKGVKNFGGGVAMVGEEGPELVQLPKGSNVIPNNEVKDFARNLTPMGSGSGNKFSSNQFVFNINNPVYKDNFDVDSMMERVMKVLKSKGVVIRYG